MKKLSFFCLVLSLTLLILSACNKKESNPSTVQLAQRNWNFDKVYDHYVQTGFPDYSDTTYGLSTDYFDFRTDNRIYSNKKGNRDTAAYIFLDDSRMIIDGDTATIQALTDNHFQLHGRTGTAQDYYEYTLFLKK